MSPWSSPQAAVESLLQHLKDLVLSFLTDLGVCRAVSFTFSHSSLTAAVQHFSPFLKYVVTEVLLTSLIGSNLASGRSILDLAGAGSV